jgi:amidase/6-aminohexanoate-cyclic-dimer hydrolase
MDYEAHDAVGLAALVAAGEATPEALLEAALARVGRWNPALNAVVDLREEAARGLIAAGPPRGPLRGVPFLLKDLALEAEDFPASGGSRLLEGTRFTGDSNLYARLKAAGLVTFGRTASPEGGVGPVTEAAVYGGPTRNPWALDRTPGGSSGGAGAAVAAGIVPAAHGSDGGGSVRIPAACCGVFGFKPTRARLPEGPFSGEGWAGMATDGWITRSVRDAAALMDATHGPDLGAPYHAPPLGRSFMTAVARPPRRLRIALSAAHPLGGEVHPECRAAVEAAGRLLEGLGHHVEAAAPAVDVAAMMAAWTRIVACGTALWVRRGRAQRGGGFAGDVEPLIASACAYADTISGADYLAAVEVVHAFGRDMAAFFETRDALVTPALAEPPAKLGRFTPALWSDFLACRLGPEGVLPYSPFAPQANASGQPAASLPLRWTAEGLPVGVQATARFGEDDALMALCAEIEAAAPWFDRRPPLP